MPTKFSAVLHRMQRTKILPKHRASVLHTVFDTAVYNRHTFTYAKLAWALLKVFAEILLIFGWLTNIAARLFIIIYLYHKISLFSTNYKKVSTRTIKYYINGIAIWFPSQRNFLLILSYTKQSINSVSRHTFIG